LSKAKKVIIIAISIHLIAMFLVYSGVFRDYTNPLVVTKYYFECLRNREGFLTYSVSANSFFDPDKSLMLYTKYNMYHIKEIKPRLLDIKGEIAHVQVDILYRDGDIVTAIVELERSNKGWLMNSVVYK